MLYQMTSCDKKDQLKLPNKHYNGYKL